MLVFAGVPGGTLLQDIWDPAFGDARVDHTVQKKAFCNEAVMQEWIERTWKPSIDGCRLLVLDSLKVHKMGSVRAALEEQCTQVEFVPPGITGISQPMDIAVMKPFKDAVRRIYLMHHIKHPFPCSTTEKRALLSRFVTEAWEQVQPHTIIKEFVKADIIPTGLRDEVGRFCVPEDFGEAPNVHDVHDVK
ncbi:unnamed protein product [Phytophthora fragariaefolia]|uniref:Unnamed protein product n=1 Tax=Phytophthora fragariaefolia TaxID=1490495 RepID=A0A9W6XVR1_9STRA|nr:unnamed protein product [Phytophthora fragariaefolia]